MRRGLEDEISIWRAAAFEPVKATHFSTATTSRTPARDDHAGVFSCLSYEGSIQPRWISEYGPAMQA